MTPSIFSESVKKNNFEDAEQQLSNIIELNFDPKKIIRSDITCLNMVLQIT